MYKVLVIINVQMLEKSIFVTVNSTVYQNQLGPFHPCGFDLLSFLQKELKRKWTWNEGKGTIFWNQKVIKQNNKKKKINMQINVKK